MLIPTRSQAPWPALPMRDFSELSQSSWGRRNYFDCFLDEEMKAQRRKVTCPRSPSTWFVSQNLSPTRVLGDRRGRQAAGMATILHLSLYPRRVHSHPPSPGWLYDLLRAVECDGSDTVLVSSPGLSVCAHFRAVHPRPPPI